MSGEGRPQIVALHYEIVVASSPSAAPAQALAAIVTAFAAAAGKGEAGWRRGALAFEVAQVRFNTAQTRAVALIRYAHAESTRSAHWVMDLSPSPERAYRAVLQEAPGLTKARLEQGLHELGRRLFPFYYKDARGKFKAAHPRLTFSAAGQTACAISLAPAACDSAIRPDISVSLDALLRRQAAKRAA